MKDVAIAFLGGIIAFWPAIFSPLIGPCVPNSTSQAVPK